MKLNEGIIGHTYRVEGVAVNETITRRLEALGVNSMTPVTLLNKKGSGSVIFKVRGEPWLSTEYRRSRSKDRPD